MVLYGVFAMNIFNDFLEEDIALMVSLPYRVGAWISRADDLKRTQRDDRQELKALEAILQLLAEDKETAPFVAEIVAQTLTYKHYWDDWARRDRQKSTKLFEDIKVALPLIEDRLSAVQAKNFRTALLRIGIAVAKAFSEEEGDTYGEALFSETWTKLSEKFGNPLKDDPKNVSDAEKAALHKLRAALIA